MSCRKQGKTPKGIKAFLKLFLFQYRKVMNYLPSAKVNKNVFTKSSWKMNDPCEAVDHQSDQRPVAQARIARHIDPVEQRARFCRSKHRGLAARRSELLLDARRGQLAAELLDPGRNMERLHSDENHRPLCGASGKKVVGGSGIGPAGGGGR